MYVSNFSVRAFFVLDEGKEGGGKMENCNQRQTQFNRWKEKKLVKHVHTSDTIEPFT